MLFGTRIKQLRATHGWTQAELAKRVGVSRETISYLEQGKYNPSLLLAHKVATQLGTTIERVFIFDE